VIHVARVGESILVVDCGSATTKGVLLDTVDGQYRFVAYAETISTAQPPWEDVTVAVLDVIHQLEAITGQTFLDQEECLITPKRADMEGVDRFLATCSSAEPLRVILAGLVRDVSLASGRRAAETTYATIEEVISLDHDPAQHSVQTLSEQVNAIWHKPADVLCIVGGTDGGASGPVMHLVRNVIRAAVYMMEDRAPPIIYAGNADLRGAVTAQLQEAKRFQVVDNVRPAPDDENVGPLQEELEALHYREKVRSLPGVRTVAQWSPLPILPTARAMERTIRYCERAWRSSKTAVGVDVGAARVTISACCNGQCLTTTRSDLGVGQGLSRLLEQGDLRQVLRWLPYELSEPEARSRLMNKALNPHTIPETREDLLLEQAAAREMLRLTLLDALPGWPGRFTGNGMSLQSERFDWTGYEGPPTVPPCEPLIASGALLARAPYHGHAALVLLDSLQPTGISTLYLDPHNLVPSLGAAAGINPLATVQALRNDGLTYVGTIIVPTGRAPRGEKVLTIRPVNQESSLSVDVAYGDLEVIPLQLFEKGTMLDLSPTRRFDIGKGLGKSLQIQYRGGSVGLMIDARGRPLEVAADPEAQRRNMYNWLSETMTAT
jgi:hypothetical protein